ncbi:MAG: helix-turn-helix domain-containing protein, partial [Chloroflexi bacterium]|nr:helix-turn-helix domain-containing protein [Chloroflexota bacterium]
MLGVHPNTVRAWTDQGRLRCLRINERGDRRYRPADLQVFLRTAGAGQLDLEVATADQAPSGDPKETSDARAADAAEGGRPRDPSRPSRTVGRSKPLLATQTDPVAGGRLALLAE